MLHINSTLTIVVSRFSKEDIFRLFIILTSLDFRDLDRRYESHQRWKWRDRTDCEDILKTRLSDRAVEFAQLKIDIINNNIEKGRYNVIESFEKFLSLLPEIKKAIDNCEWVV